jgi:glutaredoxin
MAEQIMYVKPRCPYCDQAREALRRAGAQWEERDATADPGWKAELMRHSRGTGRVPTIVRGGEVVTVGWKGRG